MSERQMKAARVRASAREQEQAREVVGTGIGR